jgi:hypothetical protein
MTFDDLVGHTLLSIRKFPWVFADMINVCTTEAEIRDRIWSSWF